MTGGEPARDAPAAADPHRLLGLAIAVAREAGEMLADQYGRPAVVGTKSSPTDVVTEMDQAAERLIRSRILAERPDDAILGEEGGQIGGRLARLGGQHCRRGRRAGGCRSCVRAAKGRTIRRCGRCRGLAIKPGRPHSRGIRSVPPRSL